MRSRVPRALRACAKPFSTSSTSSSASSTNPLLSPHLLPRFDAIRPEHVGPAVAEALSGLERSLDEFERRSPSPPSWDVAEELEAMQDQLNRVWGAVSHLMGVATSPALREAHAAALPSVVDMTTRVAQSKAALTARKALLQRLRQDDGASSPSEAATAASRRRALEHAIRSAELAGVALEGPAKRRFNDLLVSTSTLSQTFDSNVIDATAAFRLRLTRQDEVDGLSQALREQYAAAARRAGDADATAESGPWTVTLDAPSFRPFLQQARRRDLREAVYRAYISRAGGAGGAGAAAAGGSSAPTKGDNSPVLTEILALRHEMAGLLSFPDYAHVSLASKMAGSPKQVDAMVSRLAHAARPAAQAELAALRDFASRRGHTGALAQWDLSFWGERMREELYGVDEEALRAYFPLPAVLDGLTGVLHDVFGVRVEKVPAGRAGDDAGGPPSAPVWDPDVGFFRVLEAGDGSGGGGGGAHLASFYLDPYARPATKRGGAWADICVNRVRNPRLGAPGGLRLPVAYLVCNQSPPSGPAAPSLMRHSEVTTLFHEMGHGLQVMLSTVDEGEVAGISGVEWDAVELPSQFLEEFAYHPATLRRMTRHVETGRPLPDELIAKLRGARNHMAATAMLRQLHFSATDMALHSRAAREEGGGGGGGGGGAGAGSGAFDPFAVDRRIAASFSPLPPLPEDRFLCSFSHIFSGGYAAGYYSYKFAEVMSADAFAAFDEAGLQGGGDEGTRLPAVRKVGRRFRDTVLALGGSVHPSDVFRRFRGRDPEPEHLLRQYGLA
jgi:oligopeptidase A